MAFTVKEIMVPNPLSLRAEQTTFTARETMLFNGYECLYVVDKEGKPVGVVSVLSVSLEDKARRVNKLMTHNFETVREDQTVQEAALLFARKEFAHPVIPVVNAAGALVGILRIKDLVKDLTQSVAPPSTLSLEALVVQLAMTHSEDEEREWARKIREGGYASAVTQVGTTAEKLLVKLRESTIVAAIAHGVIAEDAREKMAVSNAIRDIVLQMEVVNPGLGGGYKLGIVRGEGRISVAACGRCGHALASSSEQIFVGTSTI
ncbi:MAG: CBS domain-containing protein [Candidatus Wallbacteria bacterium]|nr:CBS domain-containing protein [Candidatus Wallbacteria bacterium]MBI4869288.1 CBS domain-containing protein [Candidatus Wallbacteria bacterium]